MDISFLFNANTILQSITVGVIVYFVRVWVEAEWSKLVVNRLWTGAVLPTLSLAISLLISFWTPIGQAGSSGEKLAQALLCGFASGYVFSILKAFLKKQAGLPDSIPPEKNNE